MNWKNNKHIKDSFNNLLIPGSYEEKVEQESVLLMAQFLSAFEMEMEKKQLRKKDLANMIGTSASYITQLFRGTKIINLETIAKIMTSLDLHCEVKITGKKEAGHTCKRKPYSENEFIANVAEG